MMRSATVLVRLGKNCVNDDLNPGAHIPMTIVYKIRSEEADGATS
jgi:hypothetical protein